jgi:hypothetical protein
MTKVRGKEIFYAAVGAGDFAVEQARRIPQSIDISKIKQELPSSLKELREDAEKRANKVLGRVGDRYEDFVKRGEKTYRNVRNSTPTKAAVEKSKTARSQTKAAATSTKKAAGATAEAVKEAAGKVG